MRCSERHEQAVVGVEYLQAASVLADHTGSGETRPRFDPGDVTPAEEDDPDLPGPVSQGDLNGCDTGSGLHAHLAHPSRDGDSVSVAHAADRDRLRGYDERPW